MIAEPARTDAPGQVNPGLVRDGAHGHGYLLTTAGVPAPGATAGWRVEEQLLPGLTLHLQPRTVLSSATGAHGRLVLLGHPVDVDAAIADGGRIATRLAADWDLGGEQRLVREAADLGGRWTLLAQAGDGHLLVVPDTHASQAVFVASRGARFALASAPSLVAETLDLPVDESALTLLHELRERRGGAVTYLPGRRTAYLGVDPLIPNCLLRVSPGPSVSVVHERFWPWRERVETDDVDAVWSLFHERLSTHTELLASLGRPAVSLTAGGDSRVTAAVAARTLRERDGFAFTYVNPRDARRSAAAMADVTGASAVAAQLGLPHRVLRWQQPPEGGTFDMLHRRTYAPLLPSRGAAYAMWSHLPPDLVQLQSNCGETGTTFIRRRTDEPLSPLRLARMMMNATDGLEDHAEAMYGDYLDHAQLSRERLLGYDHHDVFYWEQRIGRWGYQKFTDGDLGHRILLPFNDRRLIEIMLSLPYPLRESKVLFERVWQAEPRSRLPRPTGSTTAAVGSRVEQAVGRLPRRVGRRVTPLVRRAVQLPDLSRLSFPGGYAVLPATRAAGIEVPRGWGHFRLPEGVLGGAVLHRHPGLEHALVEGEGGRWVLVLGQPVDVDAGIVGARPVAEALLQEPTEALAGRAAALAGRWLVLAGDGSRTVVVPDPLTALGVHLLPGGTGIVSHPGLAPGRTTPVGADEMLMADGGGLTRAAVPRIDAAADRAARLERHLALAAGGTPWLALSGGERSTELLGLLGPEASAVTWWDRAAEDPEASTAVFTSSQAAATLGVPHRVLGLREDPDGTDSPAGQARRTPALRALRRTWGDEASNSIPVSAALEETLPPEAALVMGAAGSDQHRLADRPWELVQDVRRVVLPFSDRAL